MTTVRVTLADERNEVLERFTLLAEESVMIDASHFASAIRDDLETRYEFDAAEGDLHTA